MLVWQPILVARLALSNLKKNAATFVYRSIFDSLIYYWDIAGKIRPFNGQQTK